MTMTTIFLKPSPAVSISAAVLPVRSFPPRDDVIGLRGRFVMSEEPGRVVWLPTGSLGWTVARDAAGIWTPVPSFLDHSIPSPATPILSPWPPWDLSCPGPQGKTGRDVSGAGVTAGASTWDSLFLARAFLQTQTPRRNPGAKEAGDQEKDGDIALVSHAKGREPRYGPRSIQFRVGNILNLPLLSWPQPSLPFFSGWYFFPSYLLSSKSCFLLLESPHS